MADGQRLLMRRGGGITLGFPSFTGAVKWLVLVNALLFLVFQVLKVSQGGGAFVQSFLSGAVLIPEAVVHGQIWRLVTYSFINEWGLLYIIFDLLALWMFGAEFEERWGSSIFLQFYFFCTVGAALIVIAIAYGFSAAGILGMTPTVFTMGVGGPLYGILAAYGVLYGDRDIMMFPLPFTMKARYMIIIWLGIALVLSLRGGPVGVASIGLLGGALFGYVWIKAVPVRGLGHYFSERYFGFRNRYYRWKRRRAARKFEVYMRKHDRSQYFDEYGNYKPPDERETRKPNGEAKGPWAQ